VTHLESVRSHLITLDLTDKNWSPALAAAQDQQSEVDLDLSAMSTPVFTLDLEAIAANLATMREWTEQRSASLAPHGKTTMCPALWQWQLAAGCWAITVAGEAQLRVARAAGVGRVVVANEFLSPHGLGWLAGELDADPDFDVTVWVDSVDGVELMTAHLAAADARRQLPVCVEVGHLGARGGVRDHGPALAIAKAVLDSPRLALRGVSGYEGSVPGKPNSERVGNVRRFLTAMGDLFTEVAPMVETDEALLTAGGSALFDLVAEVLAPVTEAVPNSRLLLRSGAYIVHDDGLYAGTTPAATRTGPAFAPAAHVWARVISVPEPTLALLDAGKRDVPYDAGLPVVQQIVRAGERLDAPASEIFATNDQHAYVRLEQPDSLKIGDVVRLGLSHPCTMFDKWRSALLVEGEPPRIRGAVPTFF
jgi:D-serine deaminase-like pyridoxal phosphate-dependent protein